MTDILQKEWRNLAGNIKYPFADSASLISVSGQVIPENMIIDAIFHPIGGDSSLFISKIEVTGSSLVLWFSCNITDICSATYNKTSGDEVIQVIDAYGRPAGKMVVDNSLIESLASIPRGSYLFTQSATAIVQSAILPMPEVGVRGIVLSTGEVFTGDIKIVGEDGVYFSTETVVVNGVNKTSIKVNAMGDPLFLRKGCKDEFQGGQSPLNDGPFLKTINNQSPDASGNFFIYPSNGFVEDTVLRITPTDNGLVISLVGSQIDGKH